MVEIQLTTVWIYKLRYQLVYKTTYSHGSLSEGRISPARKSWFFLPFCRDSHIEKPFGVWRHLIIHPVHIMRWKGYWAPSMLWWDSMSRGPQGVGNGQPQRQIEGSKTSVAFEDLSSQRWEAKSWTRQARIWNKEWFVAWTCIQQSI